MVSTVNTSLLMSRTDRNGHALLGSPALPVHTRSVVYIRNPSNWSEQERSLCERGRQPGLPGWLCAVTLSRTQVPMTFLSAVPGVLPLLGQPKLSQTMSMVHEQPGKAWMKEKGSPISKNLHLHILHHIGHNFVTWRQQVSREARECSFNLGDHVPDKTDYCEVRVMFVMLSKFQNIRSDRIVNSIP